MGLLNKLFLFNDITKNELRLQPESVVSLGIFMERGAASRAIFIDYNIKEYWWIGLQRLVYSGFMSEISGLIHS